MTARRSLICSIAAIAIAGCAKSPDAIAPAYVSPINYQNLDCGQLAQEDARITDALLRASKQQENARTNDAVGVLLIGLPVSSMSGDNIAPEIASLKGQRDAIRRQRLEKRC